MIHETVKKTLTTLPIKIEASASNHYRHIRIDEDGNYVLSRMHFHDEIEILYVLEGDYIIEIPDKKYFVKPGSVIFVRTGTPHSTSAPSLKGAADFIQFKLEDYFTGAEKYVYKHLPILAAYEDAPPIVIFEKGSEICDSMEKIRCEYLKKELAYDVYIHSLIYKIIGFLYRESVLVKPKQDFDKKMIKRMIPVLEYIDENCGGEITLEDIGRQFGFNISYFSRIFKTAVGMGFSDHLNFVRIHRAEILLKETDLSIVDIAINVGFSSASYFNKVFKRIKNCSPTQYRNAKFNPIIENN